MREPDGSGRRDQALPPRARPAVRGSQCHPEVLLRPASKGTLPGRPFLFFPNAVAYSDGDQFLLVRRNRYPVKLVYIKGKEIFYKLRDLTDTVKAGLVGTGALEIDPFSLCPWGSLGTI